MSQIDVIMPTYNQSEFLERAIEHILKQTFADFTFIIVNDGSTDRTHDILQALKDPRIVVVEHEVNKNLPTALNTGHQNGTSPYCTWISTDNISFPHHLTTLHKHIVENQYDLVQGYWIWNKRGKRTLTDVRKWNSAFWGVGNIGPAFLYKRNVWETYHYDESSHGTEDLKFFVQVKLHPFKLGFVESEPLVEYFSQSNSITGRIIPKHKENLDRIGEDIVRPKLGPIPRRLK